MLEESPAIMAILIAVGWVFLQKEMPCKNEIHWIMFYNFQSKITDIYFELGNLISLSGFISCIFHSVGNNL